MKTLKVRSPRKPKAELESTDQKNLVKWMRARGYVIGHMPNGINMPPTPIKWAAINHWKCMGWTSGWPDLQFILKSGGVAFLEMKRVGERVEEGSQQDQILTALNVAGVRAAWVAGYHAAIDQIEAWEAMELESRWDRGLP